MTRRLLCGLAVLLAVAGCGGSDDPKGPSATVPTAKPPSSTSSTTEAPDTPEEEVEAAYLRSWEIYTEAVRELDDSRLDEIYASDALSLRTDEIGDYERDNTPGVIDVEHDYVIQLFDGSRRALVTDEYVNHSVFIDPVTAEPTEPDPDEVTRQQFELRLVEGTWKVVYVKDLA